MMLAAPLAGACAPMLEMREGDRANELRAIVRQFCDAQKSGDLARVAELFEPKLEAAINTAGDGVRLASRTSSTCEAGRTWYIGGSRRVIEIRRDGFSDRADLWLSGEGRLFDLTYGDGSGKALG